MARISKEEQEVVKNKIISVSRKLFNEVGFDKTSTKSISKEAGIAEGTIFNYFSSKDEIFFEVFYSEYFDNIEEAYEKITFYLENEKEREKIAANGFTKSREGKFSYRDRMKEIIATAKELLNKDSE